MDHQDTTIPLSTGPLIFASPPREQFSDSDYSEDEYIVKRRSSMSSGGGSVQYDNPYHDVLRQSAKSPTTTITPNTSTSETIVTIKSANSSFSRILPKGRVKDSETITITPSQVSMNRHVELWDEIAQSSRSTASSSQDSLRGKLTKPTSKSEEKKQKKELAKMKRDQLAAELKEKQRKKAADRDKISVNSKRSGGIQGAATWEEEGAMYNMRGLVL
jgi:hypothetical protein